MARKQGGRVFISLACSDCRERTYSTQKNRRNNTQRMELTKFCPRCHGHRVHREVR